MGGCFQIRTCKRHEKQRSGPAHVNSARPKSREKGATLVGKFASDTRGDPNCRAGAVTKNRRPGGGKIQKRRHIRGIKNCLYLSVKKKVRGCAVKGGVCAGRGSNL